MFEMPSIVACFGGAMWSNHDNEVKGRLKGWEHQPKSFSQVSLHFDTPHCATDLAAD
jgi:hypothetical protein